MKKGAIFAIIATLAAIGAAIVAIFAINKKRDEELEDFDELYFEDDYSSDNFEISDEEFEEMQSAVDVEDAVDVVEEVVEEEATDETK